MTTKDRQEAEQLVKNFSVSLTGARQYDKLFGIYCVSKDALMEVTNDVLISPKKPALDLVKSFPDLWNIFLMKLGSIPFYANMDVDEREL
jgi:hypothetical protein